MQRPGCSLQICTVFYRLLLGIPVLFAHTAKLRTHSINRPTGCFEQYRRTVVRKPDEMMGANGDKIKKTDEEKCTSNNIVVSVYVCLLCDCLFLIVSSELHGRSSPNFLCLLSMAVARSSSADVVIRCVFPVC